MMFFRKTIIDRACIKGELSLHLCSERKLLKCGKRHDQDKKKEIWRTEQGESSNNCSGNVAGSSCV